MHRLGVAGTVRASFSVYNTLEEVDALADCLGRIAGEQARVPLRPASPPCPDSHSVDYPAASAASIQAAAENFAAEFEDLHDWSDRYAYLIELGRGLPAMPKELKIEDHRVRGCQSIVFLHPRLRPGSNDIVEFLADSDSEIVRGLIALLQAIFSGQPADQIIEFDLNSLLARLGLTTNLLMSRRNGLAEMVKRLRSFAAGLTLRETRSLACH